MTKQELEEAVYPLESLKSLDQAQMPLFWCKLDYRHNNRNYHYRICSLRKIGDSVDIAIGDNEYTREIDVKIINDKYHFKYFDVTNFFISSLGRIIQANINDNWRYRIIRW